METCKYCAEDIRPNAKICHNCGKALSLKLKLFPFILNVVSVLVPILSLLVAYSQIQEKKVVAKQNEYLQVEKQSLEALNTDLASVSDVSKYDRIYKETTGKQPPDNKREVIARSDRIKEELATIRSKKQISARDKMILERLHKEDLMLKQMQNRYE
jgi:cell division protein FtsL